MVNFTMSPKPERHDVNNQMKGVFSPKNEPPIIMNSLSSQQTAHDESPSGPQNASNISLKFANNKKEQGLTEKLREYESQMILDSKQYQLKPQPE